MMNQLDQLRAMTVVVADSGDFESIERYKPQDATTNPSLILQAAQQEKYHPLLKKAIQGVKDEEEACKRLFVEFACAILKQIKGRVSIEVDPKLSWDVEKSLIFAKDLIKRIEARDISRERILIKLAATWEGIQAASLLEKEGIHCNMTLIFSLVQAAQCAKEGATLISPFVGRIHDYWKKEKNVPSFLPKEDPGVLSVGKIYNYLKKFDFKTQVMGASFRNKEEILELAGSDLLTISPHLLEALSSTEGSVTRKLSIEQAKQSEETLKEYSRAEFYFLLNQDPCASFLLSDGIRRFAHDLDQLLLIIKKEMGKE